MVVELDLELAALMAEKTVEKQGSVTVLQKVLLKEKLMVEKMDNQTVIQLEKMMVKSLDGLLVVQQVVKSESKMVHQTAFLWEIWQDDYLVGCWVDMQVVQKAVMLEICQVPQLVAQQVSSKADKLVVMSVELMVQRVVVLKDYSSDDCAVVERVEQLDNLKVVSMVGSLDYSLGVGTAD